MSAMAGAYRFCGRAGRREGLPHDLSIQEMLPDHDRIHRRRVVECEECEAPRAAGGVAHDGACVDLAKLGEVLSQRVYGHKVK